jgi:uncharacterized protein
VHLTPKASTDRVIGLVTDGQGGEALKATVTARPENGKANAALIRLLARHFGLASRDISVVGGLAHRRKVVEFAGDPSILAATMTARLSSTSK